MTPKKTSHKSRFATKYPAAWTGSDRALSLRLGSQATLSVYFDDKGYMAHSIDAPGYDDEGRFSVKRQADHAEAMGLAVATAITTRGPDFVQLTALPSWLRAPTAQALKAFRGWLGGVIAELEAPTGR